MASDIDHGEDFLQTNSAAADVIVTNPPYGLAEEFIGHSLKLAGFVAMLLRTDFDHARRRARLFGGEPRFAKKLVLTRRIRWFENSKGSPSFNHAWFIWDHNHVGAPTITYH